MGEQVKLSTKCPGIYTDALVPGCRTSDGVAVDVSCCELKCASPNARFHVLVDGQLYGPFHHIRVSPLPASEPDESEARDGVTRLPVMAFMPPVEE